MALRRPLHSARSAEQHSRVTNGSSLFAEAGVDMRGVWARRFRDLFELHVSDLGGVSNISEGEQSICRRIATLTVECERLESKLAQSEAPDDRTIDIYQRTANSLRRLLESIGLQRRMRDVTPTLSGLIASAKAARSEAVS